MLAKLTAWTSLQETIVYRSTVQMRKRLHEKYVCLKSSKAVFSGTFSLQGHVTFCLQALFPEAKTKNMTNLPEESKNCRRKVKDPVFNKIAHYRPRVLIILWVFEKFDRKKSKLDLTAFWPQKGNKKRNFSFFFSAFLIDMVLKTACVESNDSGIHVKKKHRTDFSIRWMFHLKWHVFTCTMKLIHVD